MYGIVSRCQCNMQYEAAESSSRKHFWNLKTTTNSTSSSSQVSCLLKLFPFIELSSTHCPTFLIMNIFVFIKRNSFVQTTENASVPLSRSRFSEKPQRVYKCVIANLGKVFNMNTRPKLIILRAHKSKL